MSWIDSVPTGWQVKRLKYLGTARNGLTYAPEDVVDDGILVLRSSNIQKNALSFDDNIYVSKRIPHEIVLRENDLLICSRNGSSDLIGKCALIDKEMAGNTYGAFMCVYRSPNNKFVYWVLLSDIFGFYLSSYLTSTINQLTNANLLNIEILVPPLPEQQAIVAFLDDRCGYIDGIIADLERQMEILRLYKKALITETVTKGLDKSAPMKDSGIDWIGEMPTHWELKRVKHSTSVIGSGTTPESGNTDFYDGDIPWIQSGDLYGRDVIIETEKTITPLAIKSCSALRHYQNDFVIVAMYGASVGNVAISKISGYVNQACCVLLPNGSNDVRYLYYWLATCKDDLVRQSYGGGQPNISQQKIKNEPYLQAPLLEQQRIADFLDVKCAEMDALIAEKQHSVETMRQYKRSLIYEYVTGKKRVAS